MVVEFRFVSGKPDAIVTVDAAYTKNGETAALPLRTATVDVLRGFLSHKLPGVRVFDAPRETARMLRRDLDAARAAWVEVSAP